MWDTLEPLKDGLQELRLTRLCPECGAMHAWVPHPCCSADVQAMWLCLLFTAAFLLLCVTVVAVQGLCSVLTCLLFESFTS